MSAAPRQNPKSRHLVSPGRRTADLKVPRQSSAPFGRGRHRKDRIRRGSERSSGGETRTLNHTINSRVLCRLSYPGIVRRLVVLTDALAIGAPEM